MGEVGINTLVNTLLKSSTTTNQHDNFQTQTRIAHSLFHHGIGTCPSTDGWGRHCTRQYLPARVSCLPVHVHAASFSREGPQPLWKHGRRPSHPPEGLRETLVKLSLAVRRQAHTKGGLGGQNLEMPPPSLNGILQNVRTCI